MNTVMYADIALLYVVPADKITILKKLMITISVSKPLELSMEKLTHMVSVLKVTLYKYIEYIHCAELLHHVTHEAKRFKTCKSLTNSTLPIPTCVIPCVWTVM